MKSLAAIMVVCLWSAVVLSFTGCATQPTVDWNSRVGSYTYNQAVIELGPPNLELALNDGRKVAEWVGGRQSGGGGLFVGDQALRLTFGSDGKLLEWRRN